MKRHRSDMNGDGREGRRDSDRKRSPDRSRRSPERRERGEDERKRSSSRDRCGSRGHFHPESRNAIASSYALG